ncbi:MAG TPA: dihydrolipoyl dehydrogenase [Acidimicrobiia bacterium]|nr:dihydrolipoyl dehydrogenase [Acidimicrobiia bacterium]
MQWRRAGELEEVAVLAEQFDVVILGGGPAGYATALYGAAAGLDIALIEEGRVGGTCLHRGCIPAKELLQTAEVLRTIQRAPDFGVDAGVPSLDLARSQARKREVIDRLTKGLETLLKGRKVTVFASRGEVVDAAAHRVRLDDGNEVQGNNLVLATGSYPRSLPRLDFDATRVLSSDHVLDLEELPARVAIIGGGVIGAEFASMLADMGSEVTVIEALPRILAPTDKDAGNVVARSFKKRGINVQTSARVTGIEGSTELTVTWETDAGPSSAVVDKIIVSVGRAPLSGGFGLEGSGVEVDDRGFVVVDGQMRTTVDGVYAAGDVVDTPALAHVGFAEAIVIIKTILGEPVTPVDYGKVPWVVYSHPEVAWCGLTEEEARAQGHDVVVTTHRFVGDARAMILGDTDGLVKLVADADGQLLGVHLAGPWATELLGEGYLSVNWEANAADVANLIHPHPTLSEVFGEAALALTGRSLH